MKLTPQQVYKIAGETGLAPSTIRRALETSGVSATATYIAIATAAERLGISLATVPGVEAVAGRRGPQA